MKIADRPVVRTNGTRHVMSNGMNTTQRRLTALTATLGVGAACWVVAVRGCG